MECYIQSYIHMSDDLCHVRQAQGCLLPLWLRRRRDAAAVDGRRGSNVYEVNTWLWSFGRAKPGPHLGGLSIKQTARQPEDSDAAATRSEARRKWFARRLQNASDSDSESK